MQMGTTRKSITGALDGSDIIIVGAGLAGLFTALKLAPHPVTIISATPLGIGTASSWAQGGIAAAVGESDTAEAHAEDTIRAGAGLVEPKMAESVAREAPDRIEDLLAFGVPFDRNLEGLLELSREAAHSKRRVVRVKGDMAGASIMNALVNAVSRQPSIKILDQYEARNLITQDSRVIGIRMAYTQKTDASELYDIGAGAVILAAGGIGQLYEVTTNPGLSRGDALAMAARAGAIMADSEFVQFHPTAINIGKDPAPLATEALRGDGATLVNGAGGHFMKQVHDDAELAPRDIVARAVHREITNGRGAFLDCRTAIGREFPEKFPGVYKICREAGLDPIHDLIPIAPAAHYHMGGILTDAIGRTSLDGLWACGEAASTGLHGANRLASNSLLEAVVFAARIAQDLQGRYLGTRHCNPDKSTAPRLKKQAAGDVEEEIVKTLRQTMSRHVGVVRNEEGLTAAIDILENIEHGPLITPKIENMLCAAKLIATAALEREESRGGHFRSDHPQPREEFRKRSFQTREHTDRLCAKVVARKAKTHLNLVHSS